MIKTSKIKSSTVYKTEADSKKLSHDNPSEKHVPSVIHVPKQQARAEGEVHVTPNLALPPKIDSVVYIDARTALNGQICGDYRDRNRSADAKSVLKVTTKILNSNVPWDDALACIVAMRGVRVKPDPALYTALMSCCVESGEFVDAFKLLYEIQSDGMDRTSVVYDILIRACKKVGMFHEVNDLRAHMYSKGIALNEGICNRYSEKKVTLEHLLADTMTHIRESSWPEAKACLQKLKVVAEPDARIYCAAICAYARDGLADKPRQMLADLEQAGIPINFKNLSQLIACCEQRYHSNAAKELLDEGVQRKLLKPELGFIPFNGRRIVTFNASEIAVMQSQDLQWSPKYFAKALFNYHLDRPGRIESQTYFIIGKQKEVKNDVTASMKSIGLVPVTGVRLNGEPALGQLECGNAAILKVLGKGQIPAALRVLDEMLKQRLLPHAAICLDLLTLAFANQQMDDGRLRDALINAFDKVDLLVDVFRKIFDGKSGHELTVCNAMIEACVQLGSIDAALAAFDVMVEGGVQPSRTTYAAVAPHVLARNG